MIRLNLFFSFLFCFLFIQNVQANISISPVILEINAQNQIRGTSITLENSLNNPPRNYEIIAFSWTQNEKGEDVLEPFNDLVINPKTIYLPSGEKRQVRIGFRTKLNQMNLAKEKSWRILFQEIQSPLDSTGIGISVDFSVPLFAQDKANDSAPNLLFSLQQHNQLNIHNLNNAHLKIMNIEIVDTNGKVLESFPNMKYILADQSYVLKLNKDYDQQLLQAKVKVDQIEAPLLFPIKR